MDTEVTPSLKDMLERAVMKDYENQKLENKQNKDTDMSNSFKDLLN